MKKWHILPVLVAGLASWAGAAPCTDGGKELYCDWGNGCHKIDSDYGDKLPCGTVDEGKKLTTGIGKCLEYGSLYTDVTNTGDNKKCDGTWTGKGLNPADDFGYCDWGPKKAKGEDGCEEDGGCGGCSKLLSAEKRTLCETPGNGSKTVSSCDNNSSGSNNNSSGSNNNSSGSNTPVLNIQPIVGLTVVPHGRALHIASPKDARVTLYDLSGNKVFGGTVRAGNSVFSLASQAPGVYYAVVQVGSLTQTVNVVLMK